MCRDLQVLEMFAQASAVQKDVTPNNQCTGSRNV